MIKRLSPAAVLLAACLVTPVLAAPRPHVEGGGARTNDDDPGINAQGMAINKILKVLQVDPDSASDACISALKQMHKSQDDLATEETVTNNQDIGVARDVVASDMEDVSNICGADAHRMCRNPGKNAARLAPACDGLPDADD